MQKRSLEHKSKMFRKGSIVPEEVEGWKDLSKQSQEWVRQDIEADIEQGGALSYSFLKNLGFDVKEQQREAKAYEQAHGEPAVKVKVPEEMVERAERKDFSRDNTDFEGEPVKTEMIFQRTQSYVRNYLNEAWEADVQENLPL